MTKLKRLKAARASLVALRGGHDQTIRCRVIEILHGPAPGEVTSRFLEASIDYIEKAIHEAVIDELDQE